MPLKIALREGLEIHLIFEQGLNLNPAEIDLLVRGEEAACLFRLALALAMCFFVLGLHGLHGREYTPDSFNIT